MDYFGLLFFSCFAMGRTQEKNSQKIIDIFQLNFSVSRFFGFAPFAINSREIKAHKSLYRYSFLICWFNLIIQFSWFFYNCFLVPPILNFIFASTETFMIILDGTCTPLIILSNREIICQIIKWINQYDKEYNILRNKFPFLQQIHVVIILGGCITSVVISFIGAIRTSEVFHWDFAVTLTHEYMLLVRFVASFLLFHQLFVYILTIGFCYNSLNRKIFSILKENHRSIKIDKKRLIKKFEIYKRVDNDLKKFIENISLIYCGHIGVLVFILFFGYVDAFGVRLRYKMFNGYTYLRLIFMSVKFLAMVTASDYAAKQVLKNLYL